MSQRKDPSATWIHYTGEPIWPVGPNRSDGHRVKLFEESVTFIAQLHPEDQAAMVPPLDRTWMIGSWPVHEYQVPIIIGISSGILVLLLIIAVLVAWRCCHIHLLRDKTFGTSSSGRTPVIHSPSTGSYPSVLAMSVSPVKQLSPSLTGRLTSLSCEMVRLTLDSPTSDTRRADGLLVTNDDYNNEDPQANKLGERHSCEDMSLVGCGNYVAFDIPSFYEESLNTSSMSASSNAVLDVSWSNGDVTLNQLKTRSLPSWARHKGASRSAQTVNRPKMEMDRSVAVVTGSGQGLRYDAAALIAQSQSTRTNQGNGEVLSDRVSLVGHNEAVIVFNERTAL